MKKNVGLFLFQEGADTAIIPEKHDHDLAPFNQITRSMLTGTLSLTPATVKSRILKHGWASTINII